MSGSPVKRWLVGLCVLAALGLALGSAAWSYWQARAARVMADSAERVGNSRSSQEPIANCVAPDDGVAGLVFEAREHCLVASIIETAPHSLPLANVVGSGLRSLVMGIINVLNDCFAGVQNVGVWDVVEK